MDAKKVRPIRVFDAEAIELIRKNAPVQRRSLSACASMAIISALSGQNSTRSKSNNQEEIQNGDTDKKDQ